MAAVLNGIGWELTHLFEAHFADGTILSQGPDDKSLIEPETRSAFYDVQQRIDEVVVFGIYDAAGTTYAVDLRDGHFEINGVPLRAEPVFVEAIPEGGKYKLLYCRDHQQDFMMGSDGEQTPGEHRISYRLGWEYKAHPLGKVWTQTIVVR